MTERGGHKLTLRQFVNLLWDCCDLRSTRSSFTSLNNTKNFTLMLLTAGELQLSRGNQSTPWLNKMKNQEGHQYTNELPSRVYLILSWHQCSVTTMHFPLSLSFHRQTLRSSDTIDRLLSQESNSASRNRSSRPLQHIQHTNPPIHNPFIGAHGTRTQTSLGSNPLAQSCYAVSNLSHISSGSPLKHDSTHQPTQSPPIWCHRSSKRLSLGQHRKPQYRRSLGSKISSNSIEDSSTDSDTDTIQRLKCRLGRLRETLNYRIHPSQCNNSGFGRRKSQCRQHNCSVKSQRDVSIQCTPERKRYSDFNYLRPTASSLARSRQNHSLCTPERTSSKNFSSARRRRPRSLSIPRPRSPGRFQQYQKIPVSAKTEDYNCSTPISMPRSNQLLDKAIRRSVSLDRALSMLSCEGNFDLEEQISDCDQISENSSEKRQSSSVIGERSACSPRFNLLNSRRQIELHKAKSHRSEERSFRLGLGWLKENKPALFSNKSQPSYNISPNGSSYLAVSASGKASPRSRSYSRGSSVGRRIFTSGDRDKYSCTSSIAEANYQRTSLLWCDKLFPSSDSFRITPDRTSRCKRSTQSSKLTPSNSHKNSFDAKRNFSPSSSPRLSQPFKSYLSDSASDLSRSSQKYHNWCSRKQEGKRQLNNSISSQKYLANSDSGRGVDSFIESEIEDISLDRTEGSSRQQIDRLQRLPFSTFQHHRPSQDNYHTLDSCNENKVNHIYYQPIDEKHSKEKEEKGYLKHKPTNNSSETLMKRVLELRQTLNVHSNEATKSSIRDNEYKNFGILPLNSNQIQSGLRATFNGEQLTTLQQKDEYRNRRSDRSNAGQSTSRTSSPEAKQKNTVRRGRSPRSPHSTIKGRHASPTPPPHVCASRDIIAHLASFEGHSARHSKASPSVGKIAPRPPVNRRRTSSDKIRSKDCALSDRWINDENRISLLDDSSKNHPLDTISSRLEALKGVLKAAIKPE